GVPVARPSCRGARARRDGHVLRSPSRAGGRREAVARRDRGHGADEAFLAGRRAASRTCEQAAPGGRNRRRGGPVRRARPMSAADRPGRRKVKKSGGKRRFPVSVPIPRRRKDRQVETPVEETGVSGPEKDGPAAPPAEHPPGMPAGGGPSAPASESDVEIPPPAKDGAAAPGVGDAEPPGVAEDRATSVGAEEAASADVEDAGPP